MSDTATLSMDDVRRLVMLRGWCPQCQQLSALAGVCETSYAEDGCRCGVVMKPSLFTRCPGCQPESLCWGEPGEDDHGGRYKGSRILRQRETKVWIAIDLILMSIARDGRCATDRLWTIAADTVGEYETKGISVAQNALTVSVMSTDLPGAVAARHRLKDLEDKS